MERSWLGCDELGGHTSRSSASPTTRCDLGLVSLATVAVTWDPRQNPSCLYNTSYLHHGPFALGSSKLRVFLWFFLNNPPAALVLRGPSSSTRTPTLLVVHSRFSPLSRAFVSRSTVNRCCHCHLKPHALGTRSAIFRPANTPSFVHHLHRPISPSPHLPSQTSLRPNLPSGTHITAVLTKQFASTRISRLGLVPHAGSRPVCTSSRPLARWFDILRTLFLGMLV